MTLKPFFTYYGGKYRCAPHYPKPRFPRIVEPFAGSAGYSLRYPDLDVVLYDTSEAICGVWDYLIHAPRSEVMSLPLVFSHVDELSIPQEAKWIIGFWLNKGAASPRLSPSAWMRGGTRPNSYWGEAIRNRIARQCDRIRHWKVERRSYDSAPLEESTWFVDPPYSGPAGKCYPEKFSDYASLSSWCRSLPGQVVVCEMSGADWMEFRAFRTIRSNPSSRGKQTCDEVIWTNNFDLPESPESQPCRESVEDVLHPKIARPQIPNPEGRMTQSKRVHPGMEDEGMTEEPEDMPEEVVNSTTKAVQQAIPGVELPETRKRKKRTPMNAQEWADVADRLKSVRRELSDIYDIVEGATTAGDASLLGSAMRTLETAARRTEVAAYKQIGAEAVHMFEIALYQ